MVDKVEVQFGGQLSGLTAAINQATEQIEGISAPVSGVMNAFGALAEAGMAAFAVDKIASFVAGVAHAGQEVLDTSKELGMSTEQVSTLNVAFEAMGMDSASASEGLMRLSRAQEMAEMGSRQQMAAFQVLGLSMDQLKTMSPEDMLNKLADLFSHTADGTNKTALAMTLLGRAGAQMIPFLDKGREGLAEFNRIAADTGTVWTESMAEGAEKTSVEISTLGDAFKGVGITLFEAFKPAIDVVIQGLTSLVEWFNDSIRSGGDLNGVLAAIVLAFDAVIAVIEILVNDLRAMWDVAMGVAENMKVAFSAVGETIYDALTGHFSEIGNVWDKTLTQMVTITQTKFADVKAGVQREIGDIKSLLSNFGTSYNAIGFFGVDTTGGAAAAGGSAKPQVQSMSDFYKTGQGQKQYLQEWQASLDQQLIAQNLFFDRAKQAEQAFWAEKLAYVRNNEAAITAAYVSAGATQSQADEKYHQLMLAVEQKNYSFEQDQLTQWLNSYKTGLDEQEAALKNSLAAQLISQQQFHDQSIALWQDWARVVAQTYGTTSTQYQAALKQEETYEKQHTAQSEINWKAMGNIVTNDFDQMLTGMLRGTQTFQQAFARLAQNLIVSMIEACAKIAIHWAVTEAEKLTLSTTTNATIVAGDTATAAASAAAQNSVDVKPSVLKHAGSAAAAVYDDVAQIPYVGWILAPPAAAAAFAAVAAFGSFDVGAYSLPSDMIIQAHAGEMILNESQASQVRAGQATVGAVPGGMLNGGSGGGVTVVYAPTVQALDGQSVANLLKNQASTIAGVVAGALNNGNSQLKAALAKA